MKKFGFIFVAAFVWLLFLVGVQYFIQASLTFHSPAILFYGVAFFVGLAGIVSIYNSVFYNDEIEDIFVWVSWIIPIVIFVLIVLFGLTGSTIFNAKRYSTIIEIQEGVFAEEIPNADSVAIMDQETARVIGSRVMGEIDDVSQYNISGEYNMIVYQGETYRVSPLEYASEIKALDHIGVSGYVLVNCTTQEAKLVKLDGKMMYTPSSVFSYDLTRHIRKSYPSALLGKAQFEIDEEGKPFYIVPIYKTTIGLYGGKVLDKVLVVNTIDGKIDEYSRDNIPDWIEHADSIDHLAEITSDNLKYKDGFWNSFISQKNVKTLSYNYRSSEGGFKGYSSVRTNNGIEYFTGVTSVNADESILGFMFMNPKSGKVTMYNCVGAEESSAMESAEALVQNYGYKASYPFIVNVNGIETYLVALKDKTGTNKSYSLVNVKNYTISTQASTKEEAIMQYINIMDKIDISNSNTTSEIEVVNEKVTGKIIAIYNVSEEGTTYFYYTLEGHDELFVSSILNDRNQVKLKIGDTITVDGSMKDGYYLVKSIE